MDKLINYLVAHICHEMATPLSSLSMGIELENSYSDLMQVCEKSIAKLKLIRLVFSESLNLARGTPLENFDYQNFIKQIILEANKFSHIVINYNNLAPLNPQILSMVLYHLIDQINTRASINIINQNNQVNFIVESSNLNRQDYQTPSPRTIIFFILKSMVKNVLVDQGGNLLQITIFY